MLHADSLSQVVLPYTLALVLLCLHGHSCSSGFKLPLTVIGAELQPTAVRALQGFLLAMAQDVLVATEEGVGPSGGLLAGAALQLLPLLVQKASAGAHPSARHLFTGIRVVRPACWVSACLQPVPFS